MNCPYCKKELIDFPDPRWNVTKSECDVCNVVFSQRDGKTFRIDLHIQVKNVHAQFVQASKYGDIIVHLDGYDGDEDHFICNHFDLTPENATNKLKTILTFS